METAAIKEMGGESYSIELEFSQTEHIIFLRRYSELPKHEILFAVSKLISSLFSQFEL